MDDKEVPPAPETGPEKTGITESVASLVTSTISSLTESLKETASSVAAQIKPPALISNRVETAHPPVEENFDAPRMTAEELAEHAAADTQPVTKKAQEPDSVESDGEVVVIPAPEAVGIDPTSPMPHMVTVVKKKRATPKPVTKAKAAASKRSAKKAVAKSTAKKATKKAVKKSKAKKAVKKSAAKKSAKKTAKKTAKKSKTKSAVKKTAAKRVAKKTAKKKSNRGRS